MPSDDRGLAAAASEGDCDGGPIRECLAGRRLPGVGWRRGGRAVRVVTGYRARLRRRYAATEGGAATATATPSAVITASRMPSAPLPGTVTTDPVMLDRKSVV